MDFESALAHYRAHTATAEETALVERELKKFRLIEDCLAAQELPELPEPLLLLLLSLLCFYKVTTITTITII